MTDLNALRFIRHWRQWPSRLALFLIAGVLAVPLACDAAPSARKRVTSADLEGESQVPGFPTTPAILTRDYVNAFMRAEADSPNEERMLHAFKHPDMGLAVSTFLPCYFSDRLEHSERGAALLRAQRFLVGYPATADDWQPSLVDATAELAVTRTLVVPVRDYFDTRRKSYGLLIQPDASNPFNGKCHVGDDAAWQQEHETVVTIGPGIVRSVDLGQKSWGGLVVIEHVSAAGGRFCSLYGHLGRLVSVQPGQVVRQGEKVGAVGPSFSHANGGYLAHLHLS